MGREGKAGAVARLPKGQRLSPADASILSMVERQLIDVDVGPTVVRRRHSPAIGR